MENFKILIYHNSIDEEESDFEKDINYLILFRDNWDDFGYKTTFNVDAKIIDDNELKYLPRLKLAFESEENSYGYLEPFIGDNRYIEFPFNEIKNYISLPEDISYYSNLKQLFPDDYKIILKILNDSVLLHEDEIENNLLYSNVFEKSLLRDMRGKTAFREGKYIIFENKYNLPSDRFNFRVKFKLEIFNIEHKFDFNFEDEILPHNIFILIGENGVGKSQCLYKLATKITDSEIDEEFFYGKETPSFRQCIAISYSPFEEFQVKPKDYNENRKDIDYSYKYIGFRDINGDFDKKNASKGVEDAILKIIRDDLRNEFSDSWIKKANELDKLLEMVIPSYFYIEIIIDTEIKELGRTDYIVSNKFFWNQVLEDNKIITYKLIDKNENEIKLSSGQKIFFYMIINIVAHIRRNSLILIDEPECYLHPNLELTFVKFIQKILTYFESYAIIATHSMIITREVPSKFVRVIKRNENNEPIIQEPSIQTYGLDITTICNYIFDNALEEKPYQKWVEKLVKNNSENLNELILKYKDILNPETVTLIQKEKIKKEFESKK